MNKYTTLKIFSLILLVLVLSFSTNAYTPTWKVDFTNTLSNYLDHFTAGAGSPATDGYNSIDLRHPPQLPSAHIQMLTLIDGIELTKDYRADLEIGTPKKWEIKLIAVDPLYQGISGTNTITWSLENINNLNLKLIDYGHDNGRINIVNTINLKEKSLYKFDVANALGPYRYLDLVVESTGAECVEDWGCTNWFSCQNNIQTRICTDNNNCGTENNKPSQLQSCQQTFSESDRVERSRTSCTPSWKCTEWTECSSTETQTRTCTDKNDCSTTRNKPSEQRACTYTPPKTSAVEETIEKKIKEPIQKITKKETKSREQSGLKKITGAAVKALPQPILINILIILISILIIVIMVGVGLTIFYLVTKK